MRKDKTEEALNNLHNLLLTLGLAPLTRTYKKRDLKIPFFSTVGPAKYLYSIRNDEAFEKFCGADSRDLHRQSGASKISLIMEEEDTVEITFIFYDY